MLEMVHYESPQLSEDPFSRSQATKSIMGMLSRVETDTLVIIAYLNGEAIGCMGAILSPQLTSENMVASELLLYVQPSHRGSRAALSMVRAFEEWASGYDMRVGSSLGIDDNKAINFYSRLGYQRNSVGMIKRGSNNG